LLLRGRIVSSESLQSLKSMLGAATFSTARWTRRGCSQNGVCCRADGLVAQVELLLLLLELSLLQLELRCQLAG